MNGFELWSKQRFDAGRAVGINEGREEEYNRDLQLITKNLIQQAKQKGKTLTQAEALKQAQKIIS